MSKFFFLVTLATVWVLVARAQVPATLSYQGLLTNSDGTPVEGTNIQITFKFYRGVGKVLDATLTRTLPVSPFKGLFTIILGSGIPVENMALPASLGDQPCFISLTLSGR